MSTCVGAPPPHLGCPHGSACDWLPPKPKYGVKGTHVPLMPGVGPTRELQPPLNRQERRKQERQARRK